mgnify:CR=1 FL=1
MSDTRSQLATFRIEPDVWEAFKAQARRNGKTASDVLNEFCKSYSEGSGEAIASTERIDDIDSRIDEKLLPLQQQLDELRGLLGKHQRVA